MSHRFGFLSVAAALLFLIVVGCNDRRDITAPKASKLLINPGWNPFPNWSTQFSSISAGGYHTCARRNSGSIYCWGQDTAGAAGIANSRCEYWGSHQVPCVNRPLYVMTGSAVAAGYDHSCALDNNGAAYCWGDGTYGALGNLATMFSSMNPTPVPVLGGLTFSSIGAGMFMSCGVSTPGALYCWGTFTQPLPPPTNGTPQLMQMASWGSPFQVTGIAVGHGYACGTLTNTSTGISEATCVGDNSFGNLGYDPSTTPYVPLGESFQILNTGTTSHVAAHTNFTCWDENDGTVQCAGEGFFGQLGNGIGIGTHNGVGSFIPITVGGGMQLSHVTTGRFHACALDPSGYAWCWGMVGLLGDGEDPTTATQLVRGPVAVAGGIKFRALAAGDYHTCGIGTDNHIYCWGQNADGQLGTGTWASGYILTPVQALDPIS